MVQNTFRHHALIWKLIVLFLFSLSAMLEITDSHGIMIGPYYAQFVTNTTISKTLGMHSAAQSNVTTAISIRNQSATNATSFSAAGIVDRLREGNQSSFGTTNDTSYVFSTHKSEISTPNNNTHTGDFGAGVDIALVLPSFTAAAYSDHNFYSFYQKYAKVPYGTNVTTDLDMLYASVSNNNGLSAFAMLGLLQNLKWVTPQSNITVMSDADVDSGGGIFLKNGSNRYDVVILGHQEYVTQREYNNFKKFVSNGGTMVILDGNVFYAEVNYDNATKTIRLVKGHGWAFNGKSAWKSVSERWAAETATWVGSNYLCYSCEITFANNPFRYRHHEENYVTNPKDIILLDYNATDYNNYKTDIKHVIATYELNYGKGKVIALGIYSDDIITNGKFDRFLDSLLLQYASRIRD